MGLLNRVLTVQPVDREEERKNREHLISEKLESLTRFMPQDKSGLDFSGRFLDQLAAALNINKAAFLLTNEETEWFVPWASLGFDKTTCNRLRLPPEIIKSSKASEYIVFSGINKSRLKPYLSQREYSLNENLYFFPFIDSENEIFGGLLISKLPFTEKESAPLLQRIAHFCHSFSRYILQLQIRIRKTGTENHIELFSENPVDDLTLYFSGSEKTNPQIREWLLVRFDLEPFLARFAEISPGADIFRIKNDCMGLLSRFCQNKGKLWETRDRNKIIYSVPMLSVDDPDLFLHQLKSAFGTFFNNTERIPLLKSRYELWYGGSDSVFADMVESLIV